MGPLPSVPKIEVSNRTGVVQLYPSDDVRLDPGVWTPVPRLLAFRLLRERKVDIRLPKDDASYARLPKFVWMSPFSMGDGYATGAEHLLQAVIRAGGQPFVQPCWFVVKEGLLPETLELLENKDDTGGLNMIGLCMATPGEFVKLPTPYKIGLTMYESTNPLENHPEWKHECNAVDRLFVPSEYCKGVFSAFVKKPIDVITLAINPIYCIGETIQRIPKRSFTFFQYATLTGRKAPLETLEAFKKAFPRQRYPDVRMIFKTRLGIFGWSENMIPDPEDDRVTIINDNMLPERLFEMLRSEIDCMVFPSRGEGFGLPPRETMAMGVPTILSRSSGMIEVCDDRYNWPVELTGRSKAILGGDWDDPDWDQLIDTMRWIYGHQEQAFAKAREGARWFKQEHGPDMAGKKLLQALHTVSDATADIVPPRFRTPRRLPELELARELHEPFLKRLDQEVPRGSHIIVFDEEEGSTLAELSRRGYDAWGITDSREVLECTRETLRGLNRDPARMFYVHSLVDYPGVAGPYARADACLSIGTLEHRSDLEIHRMLQHQLKIAPKVFVSVPTVYYPQREFGDERLLRQNQWHDILKNFELGFISYYAAKAYLAFSIIGYERRRGYIVRNFGYMREGVWRSHWDGKTE